MRTTFAFFTVLAVICSAGVGQLTSCSCKSTLRLCVLVHLQNIGDEYGTENEWVGTKGQSRRLEGFSIKRVTETPGFSIRYYAHLQNIADTPVRSEGQFVGTRGRSLRLEGFAIWLEGPLSHQYNVYYQCHLQNFADSGIYQNGGFCGTRGQSRRLEAMKVWIVKKWGVIWGTWIKFIKYKNY
jgi:uncharacterized protein YjdB